MPKALWNLLSNEGKCEDEARAVAGSALEGDFTAVRVDNVRRNAQPQARTLREVTILRTPLEWLEDALLLAQRNARAVVGHGNDKGVGRARFNRRCDRRVRR